MEGQVKNTIRQYNKIPPEDKEKHLKEYMKNYNKEYYEQKIKPTLEKLNGGETKKGRPKKEYSQEELEKIKEKKRENSKKYYQKLKLARGDYNQNTEA
jgi:glutamate synthase domain-containing protein 3